MQDVEPLLFRFDFPIDRRTSMRLLSLLLVLALSCAPRQHGVPSELLSPGEVVEQSLGRLRDQGAFRFDWSFSRLKGQVKGKFSGLADRGDVHLKGEWILGKEREKVELIGVGEREYRLEGGKWVESARGEGTSPLAQLERILSLGEFLFNRLEKGCGVYSFKPNVAFLDPLLKAQAQGEIWIDEESTLPTRVSVADEEETLYWRFSLYDFGTSAEVHSPVLHRYEFVLEGRDINGALPLLGRRLDTLGFSLCGIETVGNKRIRVCISASEDPSQQVARVIKMGAVEVCTAVYPKEPVYKLTEAVVAQQYGEGATLGFEKGDRTKPVVLLGVVLSSDHLNGAELSYDELSRPWVNIGIDQSLGRRLASALRDATTEVYAISMDGEVLYTAKLKEGANLLSSLRVNGELSVREAELLEAIIDSGPLPCGLRVLEVKVSE